MPGGPAADREGGQKVPRSAALPRIGVQRDPFAVQQGVRCNIRHCFGVYFAPKGAGAPEAEAILGLDAKRRGPKLRIVSRRMMSKTCIFHLQTAGQIENGSLLQLPLQNEQVILTAFTAPEAVAVPEHSAYCNERLQRLFFLIVFCQ